MIQGKCSVCGIDLSFNSEAELDANKKITQGKLYCLSCKSFRSALPKKIKEGVK